MESISKEEFVKIESINRQLKRAKSPSTHANWIQTLYLFFKFIKIHPDEFVKLSKGNIEDYIESYVDSLKGRVNRHETSPNSVPFYVNPLVSFLVFNRIDGMHEAWRRIKANFPEKKRSTDEKYNELQLQKMYQFSDIRQKAVLALVLSGMRVGGIPNLKVKDLRLIEDWASIAVYAETNQEYHAFITSQGCKDITDYLDYRKRNGETITPDSPIIRNEFQPEKAGEWTDINGKKHFPESIKTTIGISQIVIKIVRTAGILDNSHDFKQRHKIMTCHGFRKYFNTVCKTSGMDSERVEMLMGHANSSLSGHYWRLPTDEARMSPQEQKMFQMIKSEFRRCIPELTIGESEVLKIKNQQLEETVNENLKEKEFEINDLKRQLSKMRQNPLMDMAPEDMEQFFEMFKDWKELHGQIQQAQ